MKGEEKYNICTQIIAAPEMTAWVPDWNFLYATIDEKNHVKAAVVLQNASRCGTSVIQILCNHMPTKILKLKNTLTQLT